MPAFFRKRGSITINVDDIVEFLLRVPHGFRIQTKLSGKLGRTVRSGFLTEIRLKAATLVTTGFRLLERFTGTASVTVNTGIRTISRVTGNRIPAQTSKPAPKIVRIRYGLTRTYGASTVDTSSQGNWTNPNNGLGRPNGTLVNMAGSVTVGRFGHLAYRFPAAVNKNDLVIQSVFFRMFYRTTGIVAGNAQLELYLDTSVTRIVTTNVNFLSTPDTVDVSSVYNTWAKLDNALFDIIGSINLGAQLANLDFDSAEFVITAQKIDTF